MIRFHYLILSIFALIVSLAATTPPDSAPPPASKKNALKQKKPSPTLILESARNNENSYSNGEFISVLRGNVVFVYDDIRIKSDEATWWRTKGEVLFKNNVTVKRERSRLNCRTLQFTKNNNLLAARGNFDYFDSSDMTRLKGNEADYYIESKCFFLRGNPLLIRYDTAAAETLTIKSTSMTYVDSLKRATGLDSVKIHKGALFSSCDRANYFTNTNQAQLRGNPKVTYAINNLIGDSINLNFNKESLRNASIVGNSHGIYVDTAGIEPGDTTFTHIWGDSLFMGISDSGKLDVIWSIGKASSKSYSNRDSLNPNTAKGKIMMLGFSGNGVVDNLKIWGNARSTYYIEESEGRGCNEVNGDSIAVSFAHGKAKNVQLAGSTRGIYFPLD